MKTIIHLFFLLLLSPTLSAQTDSIYEYEEMPHSIYFELGGQALYYSLNYERLFFRHRKWKPSLGIGASPGQNLLSGINPTIPSNISLNYDFNEKHRIHFGVGATYIIYPYSSEMSFFENVKKYSQFESFVILGYKYSKPFTNWFFGMVLTPLVDPFNDTTKFFPWGALRVGYQFY